MKPMARERTMKMMAMMPTNHNHVDAAEVTQDADLKLAALCQIFTARRLSGLRLGRKFSGQGNLSQ